VGSSADHAAKHWRKAVTLNHWTQDDFANDFYERYPDRSGHKIKLDVTSHTPILIDSVTGEKFSCERDYRAGCFRFFPVHEAPDSSVHL
jgi:hypothetical protein